MSTIVTDEHKSARISTPLEPHLKRKIDYVAQHLGLTTASFTRMSLIQALSRWNVDCPECAGQAMRETADIAG